MGSMKELVLPTDNEIKEKVRFILSEIDVQVRETPFSFAASKYSFMKIIDKLSPSDNSQQFKDGLIWFDCLSLLDEGDVYLVTSDKDFYEGREYKRGLAKNLRIEADQCKSKIYILSNSNELLEKIRAPVAVDERTR